MCNLQVPSKKVNPALQDRSMQDRGGREGVVSLPSSAWWPALIRFGINNGRQDKKKTSTIEVNGIRIPCHKLLTALRSEYISCLLQHENTEEVIKGSVDAKLLDAGAVELAVDFMYTGKIEFEFQAVQNILSLRSLSPYRDNPTGKDFRLYSLIFALRTVLVGSSLGSRAPFH